jgi:hypothetical protein
MSEIKKTGLPRKRELMILLRRGYLGREDRKTRWKEPIKRKATDVAASLMTSLHKKEGQPLIRDYIQPLAPILRALMNRSPLCKAPITPAVAHGTSCSARHQL